MTLDIPVGWKYIGMSYPTSNGTGSYNDETNAIKDITSLRHLYPLLEFDTLFDDRGGIGYERWIIIVKKNSNDFRKKSKSTKPKRKTCRCRK